jgi:predicted RNA-binding Zn-ribbon protein involved in translation (DUF1610 family)
MAIVALQPPAGQIMPESAQMRAWMHQPAYLLLRSVCSMHHCEHCGQSFTAYKVPGKCPRCGEWNYLRCPACRYTETTNVFIKNGNNCPLCGAAVVFGDPVFADEPSWAKENALNATYFGLAILVLVGIWMFVTWQQ